ncbi:MAG: rRNA maturation RNase YbeY [Treponema sp.]|nr:rRNA maturation RNase YbeY [Treponema sp.]
MNRVTVCAEDIPLPGWVGRLKSFAGKVLARLGRDGWELSVLLCGDATIAALNSGYRGKEGPTDVLSFSQNSPSPEGGSENRGFPAGGGISGGHVGDIAISLETLRENAGLFGIDEDEELRRLLIHGILHLDGMDHHTNDKAEPMLRLQEQILEELADRRILPKRAGLSGAGLPAPGGSAIPRVEEA